MKKIVDLFAGCGGLSLGFQNAGFEVAGAFEYWETAAACYEANFKHSVFREDLSDIQTVTSKIKAFNPDIIIGGPPCQDFSHAGKRVEDKRAALTEAYAEIVTAISPRWFVMENVDRAQKSSAYAAARAIFANAGYGLTEVVLDASLCGVPQKRKRFFCIGSLNANDGFLSDYITQHISDKETTLRDYFGTSLDFEYYYRHPRNYSRRAVYSIDEPSPTIRGMNRPVPPGYPGHPNDARKLDTSIRALTTLERALIQTFPPNFKWSGNKTETEQMIGNAVPVKLAEFVATALLHHIDECETKVDYAPFYNWLCETQANCERTRRDTLSRLKRAATICALPQTPDAYYLFALEQSDDYKILTPAVRSQLKRAVTLYADYRTAINANG
jgi:DNA (cytosine-5)-methyltransferase 1